MVTLLVRYQKMFFVDFSSAGPKVDVLNLNPELTHSSIEIDGGNAIVTFR